MADSLHKGHRMRLKRRFLAEDLYSFEHHNILELLLFYSIQQADTNETAHRLIEAFGGFSEVFDAPYEDLIKIHGISENSATLIKLIPSISRAYMENRVADVKMMNTPEKMGEYFTNKFFGETRELVYLLCLDSSCGIIHCDLLSKGTVSQANINIRQVVELVTRHNANSVVLAHNHPRGLAVASNDDVITTSFVKSALNQLGISLLDHVIVAKDGYCSLSQLGYV